MKNPISYFRELLLSFRLKVLERDLMLADAGYQMPGSRITKQINSIGAPAIELLSRRLKSKEKITRGNASFFLGKIFNPLAVPAFIDALNPEDSEVRISVAVSLMVRDDARAVRPLIISAIYDCDKKVRQWSRAALERTTPSGPGDLRFLQKHIRIYAGDEGQPADAVRRELNELGKLYVFMAAMLTDKGRQEYEGMRKPPRTFRRRHNQAGRHSSALKMKAAIGGARA
ncbi:HEAT repeat domain-containing protein [Candidatus Micrarchaeota archaeon]|nr:HEAT repeat domain-containing protein [Candidatus Micrarchaeota archaeon]